MDKIYISGPMKGMPNFNHFYASESKLIKEGWTVFNPANLPVSGNLTQSQHMDICLVMLRQCTDIYMMTGWEQSKEATLEYQYAKYFQIKIHHQG